MRGRPLMGSPARVTLTGVPMQALCRQKARGMAMRVEEEGWLHTYACPSAWVHAYWHSNLQLVHC